jgi:hypothetical protein
MLAILNSKKNSKSMQNKIDRKILFKPFFRTELLFFLKSKKVGLNGKFVGGPA